jgi:hypothetical protein
MSGRLSLIVGIPRPHAANASQKEQQEWLTPSNATEVFDVSLKQMWLW